MKLEHVHGSLLKLRDLSQAPKLAMHYFSLGTEAQANYLLNLQLDAERYRAIRGNPALTMEEHEAIFLSPEEIDQRADKAIKENHEK